MVSLADKITKLETILEQTPPDSPTYQTIKQSLDDLYKERDNQPQPSTDSEPEPQTTESLSEQEDSVDTHGFQALGILKGRFKAQTVLNEQKQERQIFFFRTQGKNYRLKIKKDLFFAFIKQFQYHPDDQVYISVYPFLMFIPRKPPELRFELIAWQNEPYEGKEENEFILRGLWQFIPQNRRPLITVMRNWREKEEREDLLKKGDEFKPLHIPILWKDSPVPPFRFNPKAEQQPDRYFVALKCRFIAKMDSFGVKELLSEPITTFPKYLMSKNKMEKLAVLREEQKEKERQEQEANKQFRTVIKTMLLNILLNHSFYTLAFLFVEESIKVEEPIENVKKKKKKKRKKKKKNQQPIQETQEELNKDNQSNVPISKDSDSEQEVINKDEQKETVKTDEPQEKVISETDKKVEAIPADPEINSLLEKAKASGLNDTELANLIKSTKQTVVRWRKGQSKPSRHFKDIFQHWKVENDLWFPKTDSPQFKFK